MQLWKSSLSAPERVHRLALLSKAALVTFLLIAAAVAASLLYRGLRANEAETARDHFEGEAVRAAQAAAGALQRKRLSMASMAAVISEQFPDAGEWPEVHVRGYERIVDMLAQSGSHTNMGFAPVVRYDQLADWETATYGYYERRSDYYPNGTAVSPFGRGVWRMANGARAHDDTPPPGRRPILVPIIQCCIDNPGDPIHLFNLYSEPVRRRAIDGILDCADRLREASRAEPNRTFPEYSCGTQTEFTRIVRFRHRGPAAIFLQPIYAAEEPWTVLGLVLSPVVFDEIFEDVFSQKISGVYAVLEAEAGTYTYIINRGLVESYHEGGPRETEHEALGISLNLTQHDLHAMGAPMVTLTFYPTAEYFEARSTVNPRNAALAAVFSVVVAVALFLLYDYLVRREISERRQLLEAKRRFVRYISHEVRTPLNAVIMGLAILKSDLNNDVVMGEEQDPARSAQEHLHLLEEVETSAGGAVEVLNEVLQYDKVERSCLKLDISMVAIWDEVEKTIAEFRLPAAREKVHMKVTFEANNKPAHSGSVHPAYPLAQDLPPHVRALCVMGDVARIAQILRNLVSNALKFTSAQGQVLVSTSYYDKSLNTKPSKKSVQMVSDENIELEARGFIQIAVTDTGAGMTEEQLKSLFGEGVQFNVNKLQGGNGSGLGLYITKNLVEQHGGLLTASSPGLGLGTRFVLQLPLYFPLASKATESTPADNLDEEEIDSSYKEISLRILVVDDVLSNRKLLSRLLERKGHSCDQAEDGAVACDRVKKSIESGDRFDCILIDYEMPVMNGPAAVSYMREKLGCDTVIIGVTGNMLSEDVDYFKSQGANAVLPKPVEPAVLEEIWMELGIR